MMAAVFFSLASRDLTMDYLTQGYRGLDIFYLS